MQPRPLPPEITILIIDYLYDHPASLKNCSRVSHSWLAISRSHLFHRVEFNLAREGAHKCFERLHSAIEKFSSISLYIRELTISNMIRMPDSENAIIPHLFVVCRSFTSEGSTGVIGCRMPDHQFELSLRFHHSSTLRYDP
jgi:hypothetical protein